MQKYLAFFALVVIGYSGLAANAAESSMSITDILSPSERAQWQSALKNIREEVRKHENEIVKDENSVVKDASTKKLQIKPIHNKTIDIGNYFTAVFARLNAVQKQYENAELMLFGFSYDDCSGPSDPVHVRTLHVSPDPIPIPGNIVVDASAEVLGSVGGNLKASIKLETEIFGHFFEIPCIDNVGSCDYDDLCSLLPKQGEPCPPILAKAGVPCRCPFPAGKFSLPSSAFAIPSVPLPIKSATVRLTAHLTADGNPVTCVQIKAKVQKKD